MAEQPLPQLSSKQVLLRFKNLERDGHRRLHYTLFWWTAGKPVYSKVPGQEHICVGYEPGVRGQVFHMDPDEQILRWLREGGIEVLQEVEGVPGQTVMELPPP